LNITGEIPSINVPPRAQPQLHQLFAGGDWAIRQGFSVNMGIGFDLGSNGPGLIPQEQVRVGLGEAA